MERRYYANKQYSWRECIEISGILANLADNGIKSKVFEILKEINVPIDPSLAEDCHRLPSKGLPEKVIIKLNRCQDIHRILLKKNKLKNLKPESVNLPGKQMFSLIKVCACTCACVFVRSPNNCIKV